SYSGGSPIVPIVSSRSPDRGARRGQLQERSLQDQPGVEVRLVGQVGSGLLDDPHGPSGQRRGGNAGLVDTRIPVDVDEQIRPAAAGGDGDVPPVGCQRQQRRVEEFPFGPSKPPFVLLL